MLKYYGEDDLKRIKNARNYKDLLSVATKVLNVIQINNRHKPICMVCGPISTGGKPTRKENLKIFDRAINRLSAGGLVIFSQMPFEDAVERIYKADPSLKGLRLLEEFYLPIFTLSYIDMLCFLPGWTESFGASWEHAQAERLEIPRIYLSDYYTRD